MPKQSTLLFVSSWLFLIIVFLCLTFCLANPWTTMSLGDLAIVLNQKADLHDLHISNFLHNLRLSGVELPHVFYDPQFYTSLISPVGIDHWKVPPSYSFIKHYFLVRQPGHWILVVFDFPNKRCFCLDRNTQMSSTTSSSFFFGGATRLILSGLLGSSPIPCPSPA